VLVQTLVEGRAAADVLVGEPRRRAEVIGALSTWLERWNRATVTAAPALDRIEDELRHPARELGDALPAGYLDWLAERGDELADGELPVVARHNDLTMWNVRLDGSSEIGVLDWADADRGLPLTDLFYALADAAAACDGYRDRVAALQGALGEIAPLRDRLRESVGLSAEAAELAFHACWLRHARNDQRTDGDGQFLRIMRWVAARALEDSR
jgi:Ser/Thr protein kinase RdoA (MazF antagonist)